jgi:hypothetical protein
MDSKQLYNAAEHLTPIVTWDNDWIYFGTGDETKNETVNQYIDNFLVDENLKLVHKRLDSGQKKKTEIKKEIEELLGQENFQIWNESMTRVIDFNRIGVLKLGRK